MRYEEIVSSGAVLKTSRTYYWVQCV